MLNYVIYESIIKKSYVRVVFGVDGFETCNIVNYENLGTDKKEKLSKRIFRSRAFKIFLSVFGLSVLVSVGFVIYNDTAVRAIDYGKQNFVFVSQQTDADLIANTVCESKSGSININTASADELMSLPEIGRLRAEEIIRYRNENGCFRTTEELMSVKFIKEKVYNSIKDFITVE